MTGRPQGGVFLVVGGERFELDFDLTALRQALAPARRARLRQLERQARRFREVFPRGSANDFHRLVGGRRTDALAAFRLATNPNPGEEPSQEPGEAASRFPFAEGDGA